MKSEPLSVVAGLVPVARVYYSLLKQFHRPTMWEDFMLTVMKQDENEHPVIMSEHKSKSTTQSTEMIKHLSF